MKATFAAGCFWQVEADFRRVEGVTRTSAGYTGGSLDRPTYEDVCTDRTGHAEAVEVEFDPEQVSYGELLEVFWSSHDPTQLNRQGPDVGTQYRSAIFVHDEDQERQARASKERAQERFDRRVVTEIVPAATFWPAEDYHQRYLEKRGLASCTLALQEAEATSTR
jgi:peptide-methionine (S)-S-oxide reductase